MENQQQKSMFWPDTISDRPDPTWPDSGDKMVHIPGNAGIVNLFGVGAWESTATCELVSLLPHSCSTSSGAYLEQTLGHQPNLHLQDTRTQHAVKVTLHSGFESDICKPADWNPQGMCI